MEKARRHAGTKARGVKPLNTTQLGCLRRVYDDGRLGCDGSTGKALVDRGYATRDELGDFWITPAGRERARKKADKVQLSTRETQVDLSLLKDLCPVCNKPCTGLFECVECGVLQCSDFCCPGTYCQGCHAVASAEGIVP